MTQGRREKGCEGMPSGKGAAVKEYSAIRRGKPPSPAWYFDFEVDVEVIFDIAVAGGLIVMGSVVRNSRRMSEPPIYQGKATAAIATESALKAVQKHLRRVGWTQKDKAVSAIRVRPENAGLRSLKKKA